MNHKICIVYIINYGDALCIWIWKSHTSNYYACVVAKLTLAVHSIVFIRINNIWAFRKQILFRFFLQNSNRIQWHWRKKIGYKIGFEWQQRLLSKTISWKFKSFFFKKKVGCLLATLAQKISRVPEWMAVVVFWEIAYNFIKEEPCRKKKKGPSKLKNSQALLWWDSTTTNHQSL